MLYWCFLNLENADIFSQKSLENKVGREHRTIWWDTSVRYNIKTYSGRIEHENKQVMSRSCFIIYIIIWITYVTSDSEQIT